MGEHLSNEAACRLIHWNELDRGGHFAAFEQPALFTKELRACFRSLR
jgi:pimeloyl-ACP methyl ester carboxylesterase